MLQRIEAARKARFHRDRFLRKLNTSDYFNDAPYGVEILEVDVKKHLFSSRGQHIANFADGYLYSPGGRNIGRYLEKERIFVDRRGKYLGELFGEHRLLRRSPSPYEDIVFDGYDGPDGVADPESPDDFGKIGKIVGFEDIPQEDPET